MRGGKVAKDERTHSNSSKCAFRPGIGPLVWRVLVPAHSKTQPQLNVVQVPLRGLFEKPKPEEDEADDNEPKKQKQTKSDVAEVLEHTAVLGFKSSSCRVHVLDPECSMRSKSKQNIYMPKTCM